jgi:hypothetical protein
VKGWRLFKIADGVFVRRLDAFSVRLAGRGASLHEKGNLVFTNPRVMSPGIENFGKRQADRSDVRQKYVRLKKPDPARAFGADGRQPFMPLKSISRSLPLRLVPSVSPVRGGCGRLPSGALRAPLRAPFTQRWIIVARFRPRVKYLL